MLAVLLVNALAGGAVAQSDDEGDLYTMVEDMIPTYNENVDAIDLGSVNLAGTTNISVEDGDEERLYSVTMNEQNRITNPDDSRSEDAVRKITTDRATIEGIAGANNPAAAFRTAVVNDDIVISGEEGQFVEGVK